MGVPARRHRRPGLNTLATGFRIGSFAFSPLGILTGIVVFAVGYLITRWFQGWLDEAVMARGRVDSGVRNSIRTVVGYAGLALAGIIGISSAGIDLSNLALIAGGLSLGIGFGLQNVVSNFVSGLILLAERPFKAGDWIVAGDCIGHRQEDQRSRDRNGDIPAAERHPAQFAADQQRGRKLDTSQQAWPRRDQGGHRLWVSDVKRVHAVLLEIARASIGVEKPRTLCPVRLGPAALNSKSGFSWRT